MTKPMFSQTRKRTHVMTGRLNIRYEHDAMPRIGNSGPNGTRNGRGASGRFTRSINTAAHTTTNANSVPMLVISPTTWICVKPATIATTTHVMIVVMYGVPNLGWTLLTPRGSRPSRLIAKKMRGWLKSITSSTEVMPATAPADTRYAAQSWLITDSAYATGALRK